LVGWLFHQIKRESYAHERVTALREVLLAMNQDGEIEIEFSQKGRLMAVSLPSNAFVEEVHEEDYEFFDSNESVWLLVASLTRSNHELTRQVIEGEAAFNELANESQLIAENERLKELYERLLSEQQSSTCDHEELFASLERQYAAKLEHIREECRGLMENARTEFKYHQERDRERYRRRAEKQGRRYSLLERELREKNRIIDSCPELSLSCRDRRPGVASVLHIQ
jgi:hypothetical protein